MRRVVIALLLFAILIAAGAGERSRRSRELTAARLNLDDGVLRTVILGDSLARGAGDELGLGISGSLERHFHESGVPAAVANLGINGARTLNVWRLLKRPQTRTLVRAADVIVLSIGGNDLYGDSNARLLAGLFPRRQQQRTLAKVEMLVRNVRALNPAARVYVLGLYNPYRRSTLAAWLDRQVNLWDSRLIERFAASREVAVVRICDLMLRADRTSRLDHFHPGAAGYAAIAARIAASL